MAVITLNSKYVRPLIDSTVVPKTAGEAMFVGALVYFFDDNTVKLTDADTVATVDGLLGIIVAGGRTHPNGDIVLGERVTVLEKGRVEFGPDNVLDITKLYYASNTPGKLADAVGTVTRYVGKPESSHAFIFEPSATSS